MVKPYAVTISISVNRFLGCLTAHFHVPRRAGRKDEVSGEGKDVEGNDRHSFQRSIPAWHWVKWRKLLN